MYFNLIRSLNVVTDAKKKKKKKQLSKNMALSKM